jgi:hypothetical protein
MQTRKLKLSRKIKTIDDLFARDNVNDILDEVSKDKKDITDMIILYKTSDGCIHYSYAIDESDAKEETLKALGLLEYVKNMILFPESED